MKQKIEINEVFKKFTTSKGIDNTLIPYIIDTKTVINYGFIAMSNWEILELPENKNEVLVVKEIECGFIGSPNQFHNEFLTLPKWKIDWKDPVWLQVYDQKVTLCNHIVSILKKQKENEIDSAMSCKLDFNEFKIQTSEKNISNIKNTIINLIMSNLKNPTGYGSYVNLKV